MSVDHDVEATAQHRFGSTVMMECDRRNFTRAMAAVTVV
jgi:hypothetical protein